MKIRKINLNHTVDLNRTVGKAAWLSLILAVFLFLTHFPLLAKYPYRPPPLEMRYGSERIIVNLAGNIVAAVLLFGLSRKENRFVTLRRFYLLLAVALMAVLASVAVNSVYNTGLCCENPLATFWGFPFSWLLGIAQDPPFDRFDRWTTLRYLLHFYPAMRWHVILWKWVVDFLFWWLITVSCDLLITRLVFVAKRTQSR